MELTGNVKRIGQTNTYGSNGFTKRNLVIETEGDYPQTILIEFHKDNCEKLDGIAEGQQVTVGINLRGREWTSPEGKVSYFNTLVGWKIDAQGGAAPAPAPAAAPAQAAPAAPLKPEAPEDDLPF